MTVGRGDWLDAAARRLVEGSRREALETETTPTSSDEVFSRATAFKLAVAGVASVSFGLWRVTPVQAQTRGQCYEECDKVHDADLDKKADACIGVFSSKRFLEQNPLWKQLLLFGIFPGTAIGPALAGLCIARDTAVSNASRDNCRRRCQETCRTTQARSLQGSSAPHQVCEATPPPKPYTPAPPPAPNHTEDPCWSCVEVGGACCGPFKGDPNTGSFTPCACANPSIGCAGYGCGG